MSGGKFYKKFDASVAPSWAEAAGVCGVDLAYLAMFKDSVDYGVIVDYNCE